ncbi:hypothetical protein ACQPXM_01500 [Kribbella sp. CA-253562]|uniref:hypothetical protein n=1 Tax=Kribbella sp. CA-253562 TaxID=3239942 RepID=UPI003D8ED05F
MTKGYRCKNFSIGLPDDAEDQSLTALFKHVADRLAEDDPISMDDMIAIGFETELGDDAAFRGTFTIVFADEDSATATPATSPR